jgi:hypothetical protein
VKKDYYKISHSNLEYSLNSFWALSQYYQKFIMHTVLGYYVF